MPEYRILPRNAFLETLCRVVPQWAARDVVSFAQTVDLSAVERLRQDTKGAGQTPFTFTAAVVKAISLTLREHPKANRMIFERFLAPRLVEFEEIHAAVAIERPDEAVDMAMPAILRHTDRMDLGEISRTMQVFAVTDPESDPSWRKFRFLLRHFPAPLNGLLIGLPAWFPSWWVRHHGGSFLLTSPAKYGVETIFVKSFWPLTFSFGQVKPRALVVNGKLEVRLAADLTLSWDRRAMTGAVAARFFGDLVQRLTRADLGNPREQTGSPGPAPKASEPMLAQAGRA